MPEANSSLAGQAKVHDRVHNTPPLDTILSQMNPIHTITPYLTLEYYSSIEPYVFQHVYASEFPTKILCAYIVSFM
jgi:hypothetical protein